jgi:hypothetical protein
MENADSEARRDFYYLIGLCITRWSQVEDKLFQICKHVLKSDDKHVAIVYFRTPAIQTRLMLTTELIHSVLPKKIRSGDHDHPLVIKWKNIVRDIEPLLKVRNALAHYPPHVVHSAQAVIGTPKGSVPPAPPSIHKVKISANEKLRGRDEFEVTGAELPDHLNAVEAVTKDLQVFFDELKAHPR